MGDALTDQFTKEEIELLKKGDPTVFTKLFKSRLHHIRHYCEKVVKDKVEAEDIALLSFTKYLERAGEFNSVYDITAFLYVTARNACYNYLDKVKARENYTEEVSYLASEAIGEQVTRFGYEAVMFEHLFAKMIREVDKLPDQCQRVFKMRVLENKTNEEVAEQLGIAAGTVRMHLSTARKKLKEILGDREFYLLVLMFFSQVPELQDYICHQV